MVIVDFRRKRMDNQNNRDNNSNNNRQGWGIILFTTLLVTFVVMALYSMMQGSSPEEITYDRFLELGRGRRWFSPSNSGATEILHYTDG